ncbi:MAG: hypothetical protein Q4B65_02405 [Candidatus Saccharibacteria bacterium]|nr:hypothetical protein [Candidatus Saccharibacteria bacterium]
MRKTKKIKQIGKAAVAGLALFGSAMMFFPYAGSGIHAAQEVDFSVTIEPSLQIVLPEEALAITVAPKVGEPVFTSQDYKVMVATNNMTGYSLSLAADSTALQRTIADTDGSFPTIETLDAKTGGYTAGADFTINRWGYKIADGNYLAFETGAELGGTDGPTNGHETDLNFGVKIDMSQAAGTYELGLMLVAVANALPEPPYLQDYTLAECSAEAASAPVTLTDRRDMKEYTVRYINDTCWMTQNLAYDLTGVTQLSETDTDVTGTVAFSATDNMTNSYTDPYFHVYTESERNGMSAEELGILYNYAAASAGTIKNDPSTDSSTAEATSSICPKGWTLPSSSQQEWMAYTATEEQKAAFSPVYSGSFYRGSVLDVGSYGRWWSSTANDEYYRYYLYYYGGSLYTDYDGRRYGYSVRCVLGS